MAFGKTRVCLLELAQISASRSLGPFEQKNDFTSAKCSSSDGTSVELLPKRVPFSTVKYRRIFFLNLDIFPSYIRKLFLMYLFNLVLIIYILVVRPARPFKSIWTLKCINLYSLVILWFHEIHRYLKSNKVMPHLDPSKIEFSTLLASLKSRTQTSSLKTLTNKIHHLQFWLSLV